MTRTVTLAGFAMILLAALALELWSRRHDRATLVDTITRAPRLVTLTAWLWLGWHLFARVDW
jgi:hypothetical protein